MKDVKDVEKGRVGMCHPCERMCILHASHDAVVVLCIIFDT